MTIRQNILERWDWILPSVDARGRHRHRTLFQRPTLLLAAREEIFSNLAGDLECAGITNLVPATDLAHLTSNKQDFGLAIIDSHQGGNECVTAIMGVRERFPDLPAIVLSDSTDSDLVVRCIHAGAIDFIPSPFSVDRLWEGIHRALEFHGAEVEQEQSARHFLDEQLQHPQAFRRFTTQNSRMLTVFQYCEAIAGGHSPVLVTGETGVGKELIPPVLHTLSERSGEYVVVNVAGLDDNTFSDTLFGHLKGAFTGAAGIRKGLIEQAEGGTLFLDEIGDLSPASQVKLLRLLEQKEYFPLGADRPKQTDARVIVATHKDLKQEADAGRFRRDLYYRLATHHISLPLLCERKDDIPLLLDSFLEQAGREFGKRKPTYHPELLNYLITYDFPGNIRELRAMVFDAVGKHNSRMLSGEVFRAHIARADKQPAPTRTADHDSDETWLQDLAKLPTLKTIQTMIIDEAMRRSSGNLSIAASLLGVSRQALTKRLQRRDGA